MAESFTIDATPTWAGLMPALVLALTHGTREGRRIAAEELQRLAAAVDAANAKSRAAPSRQEEEEARNQFGLESVRLGRERAGEDIARHARTLQAAGLFLLESVAYSAAAIADPVSAGDYQAAARVAQEKAAAADLARREALALARSCLAAIPAADLERPQEAKTLRAAQDLRDVLAGLVAAMPEGGQQ